MKSLDSKIKTEANPTMTRWWRPVLWGLFATFAFALLKLVEVPWTLAGIGEYFHELGSHVSEHVLVFFAGGLLEELFAVREVVHSLGSLRVQLPLIERVAESSLLMEVAEPLLKRSAGIDTFPQKKRELACCLLAHCHDTMAVILNPGQWISNANLFQDVKSRIAKLVPPPGQPSHRIVSAYLMSLIHPNEWKDSRWESYQKRLFAARRSAVVNGAHLDFKRIHVLDKNTAHTSAGWNNLVSLMVAEAIMGFYVRAMLLDKSEVRHVVEDHDIGYTFDGAHLYDCGVYQGVQQNRFVVLADLDPYFMSTRKSGESAIVSDHVGLLDILRRNFNLAWSSDRSVSLYRLLKSPPAGIAYRAEPEMIASFIWGVSVDKLKDLPAVVDVAQSFASEELFWKQFEVATAGCFN